MPGKKGKTDSIHSAGSVAQRAEELNNYKLDLQIMDMAFDKWLKEEESLSGVLNVKVIKQSNNVRNLKLVNPPRTI